VKSLEGQISELESEASRLLRALDTAKEAKAEVERTERKRAEELAREVSTQVSYSIHCLGGRLHCADWADRRDRESARQS
jgi:homeobox protein cut-like